MRINTNIASLNAQESSANTNKALTSSLEKLSTGLRINKAADDASGMSIADKLRTQASSLGQAISNANSGSALIQIADKAMGEQSNILDIVKTKLIQASTETTSSEGREAIRKDISKLLEQFDNIAGQTNYNGINLLDTKGETFNFQVGEDSAFDIEVTTAYAANTSGVGGGSTEYEDGVELTENGESAMVKNDGGDLKNTITVTSAAASDLIYTIQGVDVSYAHVAEADDEAADGLAAAVQALIDDGSITGITVEAEGGDVIIRPINNGEAVAIVEKQDTNTNASMTTVTNSIAIGTDVTTAAGGEDASFTVGGNNIDKVTLAGTSAAAAITIKTADAELIAKLDTMMEAGQDTSGNGAGIIAKTSDGVYTLTQSAAGANATLTFSGGIDVGDMKFEGLAIGTHADVAEALIFETEDTLTVTNESTVDFKMDSSNGTDYTTATASGNLIGGNTLGSLKTLSEDGLTAEVANDYMQTIDEALSQLNSVRSDFGSTQNQLESFTRNAMTTKTNLKAAESVIRDTDFAAESATFNKQNIIAQAGTYAMSQANSIAQNVQKLLQ